MRKVLLQSGRDSDRAEIDARRATDGPDGKTTKPTKGEADSEAEIAAKADAEEASEEDGVVEEGGEGGEEEVDEDINRLSESEIDPDADLDQEERAESKDGKGRKTKEPKGNREKGKSGKAKSATGVAGSPDNSRHLFVEIGRGRPVTGFSSSSSYIKSHRRPSIPTNLQGAKTVGHQAVMRHLVVSASLIALGCAITTALCIFAATLREGSTKSISPALCVFAVFLFAAFVASLIHARNIYKDTRGDNVPTWEWHHSSYLRILALIFWEALWVVPALMVFVLHCRGQTLSQALKGFPPSVVVLITLLFLFTIVVLILDGLIFYFIYSTVKQRWKREVEKPRATFAEAARQGSETDQEQHAPASEPKCNYLTFSKFLCASALILSIALIALYLAIAIRTQNEGAWVAFAFHLILSGAQCGFLMGMLLQSSRSFAWYLTFRASTGVHVLFSYFFFWINIIILITVEHYKTGFWEEVNRQAADRELVVWFGLAGFILMVLASCWAIYLHKFTKGQQWASSTFRTEPYPQSDLGAISAVGATGVGGGIGGEVPLGAVSPLPSSHHPASGSGPSPPGQGADVGSAAGGGSSDMGGRSAALVTSPRPVTINITTSASEQ